MRWEFTVSRTIFLDETGSLTGLEPNSWAVFYWKHLAQPECQNNTSMLNGLVCDSTVQVRRVVFFGAPSQFNNMELKIARYDD